MSNTYVLEKKPEGLLVPAEFIVEWEQVELVRYANYMILRAKSRSAPSQKEKVVQALRQANLIVEPDWEVSLPVSAERRATMAQELSNHPSLSQLVLSDREERI